MLFKAWALKVVRKSLYLLFLLATVLPLGLIITYHTVHRQSRNTLENLDKQTTRLKKLLSISETAQRAIRYGSPREYCQDVNTDDISPEMFKNILYNDKYKILYCQIPKAACTNWRRIMLVLSGHMNTTNLIAIPARNVHTIYDQYLSYLGDLTVEEIQYRIKHYYKFIFTREPFERILSAYRNKFQSKNDFFHYRFGKGIAKRYRANSQQTSSKGSDVTFLEYVQYLTDYTRIDPLNEHWERMTRLCHPCLMNYDMVSSYDDLEKNSNKVLRRIGVANVIHFPTRSIAYKHVETDRLLRRYYSMIPAAFLDQLMEVYYPDFLMFHYKVPASMRNLSHWQVKF